MTFRFVHTADLHLDSPLSSLALRNGELAELVRGATRAALSAIVDLCIEEAVDGLLIAGDLYDGSQTSMNTALFLVSEMRRLETAGIRVFVIRGNHDSQSVIRRELTFPANVHLFTNRAKSVRVTTLGDGREVHVHGIGFDEPHAPESLLPQFPPPVTDAVNIGMLHTSLAGAPGHDRYAPCSVADLVAHGYDYWALGHVHARTVHSLVPPVVMPGMPQGRDINEAGEKSVTLVTLRDDGTLDLAERRIGGAVFSRLSVDLTGIEDWRDMLARIAGVIREAAGAGERAQSILRIRLEGVTPLAWRLRRDPDFLTEEVVALAHSVPGLWVEKIEIAAQATAATGSALDPASELAGLIAADVLPSHAFRQAAGEMVAELLSQLPRELREIFGTDEQAAADLVALIGREGSADMLAHLKGADSGSVA